MTTGIFVSHATTSVTLTVGGKSVTKSLADNCSVTLNGADAKLADLKPGDSVELSGDPATRVSATR